VSERLLGLLQRLAVDHGIKTPLETTINVRLTQSDIASLIGSTRETVSVEMADLVRAGVIRMERHFIVLVNTEDSVYV
jgi:CRP-like cAMP-binding protein